MFQWLFIPCAVLCLVVQSCLTLWPHGLCSHQAPLSMGILRARILKWVAMPSSRGSFQPRDQTQVSCNAGIFFTVWAIGKPIYSLNLIIYSVLWLEPRRNGVYGTWWAFWPSEDLEWRLHLWQHLIWLSFTGLISMYQPGKKMHHPQQDSIYYPSFFPLHECMAAKSLQSCPTLCDPMDCSPPGSSVHGILQARILEWVAMPSSRGSSQPRDWTGISYVSCIGRRVLYHLERPSFQLGANIFF